MSTQNWLAWHDISRKGCELFTIVCSMHERQTDVWSTNESKRSTLGQSLSAVLDCDALCMVSCRVWNSAATKTSSTLECLLFLSREQRPPTLGVWGLQPPGELFVNGIQPITTPIVSDSTKTWTTEEIKPHAEKSDCLYTWVIQIRIGIFDRQMLTCEDQVSLEMSGCCESGQKVEWRCGGAGWNGNSDNSRQSLWLNCAALLTDDFTSLVIPHPSTTNYHHHR